MKPNVICILSDQQRWDTLGCYGHSNLGTYRRISLFSRTLHYTTAG